MKKEPTLNALLNILLEKCLDNEIGYLKILRHTENHEMLELLDNRHEASCLRVLALKDCFLDLNITPIQIENYSGDEFNKWLDVNSIINKTCKKEIFNEILVAEKKSIEDYSALLKQKDIPEKLKRLLSQQKKGIESSVINLSLWED